MTGATTPGTAQGGPMARAPQAPPPRTRAGSLQVTRERLGEREAIVVRSDPARRAGALTLGDGALLRHAADRALEERLALVLLLSTSGAAVGDGVGALHGWGLGARALARCSGVVPVLAGVLGPALSGPALLLGLADIVVFARSGFAYVTGPNVVAEVTGEHVDAETLGGIDVHARHSGVATLEAADPAEVVSALATVLSFLPDDTDHAPPHRRTEDPPDRRTEQLLELLPATPTGAYDVRDVVAEIVDDGELLELRARWAPQIVTVLARVGGAPVGVVANQPRTLAGTLDIEASQKAARFVTFCDSFNLPILTLVDTPGFLPGKDLEWRGMIRHGAELAFAYAEATVPRLCLVLRKAYGGAYIVMDSKGVGSDLTLAWPGAEIAVMGAQGAVQILHRRAGPAERVEREEAYRQTYLTPWIAAERGLVDDVIDPADSRRAIVRGLEVLLAKREVIRARKHPNGPL